MTETPVIIRRGRKPEAAVSTSFAFTDVDFDSIPTQIELKDFRKKAWEIYKTQSLPSMKDEAWRRTDLSHLDPAQFCLATNAKSLSNRSAPGEILAPLTDKEHAGQIVLSGTETSVSVSSELAKRGVIFSPFSKLAKEGVKILGQYAGSIIKAEEGLFPSLAQSMAGDGILVYVPKNVKVDQPLHSLLWAASEGAACFSHVIVVMEENSELTYIHESASPEDNSRPAMHAGVMEIHVGPNSRLQFVELQSFGKNVWNFSNERARVEANGSIEWTFGAIGSKVTKNFTDLDLAGEGAVGKMSGFYFTDGSQHLDHDTQQNHLAPHTTSDLLFKGALLENSHSIWQGMIYVAPNAQKTDGYQSNRNLVLSKNAHADSIPGLEILADDVRCTHGATVGKIDQEEVFYLQSRGIPKKEAERLIVEGFFDPIMQRIPFEGVRNRFQQYIHNKMAV